MPEEKKKKKCKICPKKPCKHKDLLVETDEIPAEEETFYLGEEVEEELTDVELPCLEEQSCNEVGTAGYVLQEVFQGKKREKFPFFCLGVPKYRYENMLPVEITNDHQSEAANKKTVLDHLSALKVSSEPFCKRRPCIIATIGPCCSEVKDIENLLESGMNIARINMAYGDRCCQVSAIDNFKTALKNYHVKLNWDVPVGLLMDLKGPEIRTGRICSLYSCDRENPKILIEKGSLVKLTTEVTFVDKCTPNLIYIDFPSFAHYVRPGMTIYIDDGSIQLTIRSVKNNEVLTVVEEPGNLRNYRPVHVPMVPFDFPILTNIDAEDIEFAIEEDFDFIAVSKIRNAEIIQDLRGKVTESLLLAKKVRERPIMILGKISNFQALRNIDDIIKATDGIIIQRGDLGLDLPPEKVYIAQREIIGKCNLANKPVICSSQLMKSMLKSSLVDRSNVFDVASCIEDGADGVCLTAETAVGDYPSETIEQTHHILREADAADSRKYHYKEMVEKLRPPIEPIIAIGMAACIVADKIKASSIIVLTTSGKSAKIISWFRPRCVVIAVTRFERTARQLHLWRSICPLIYGGACVKNNWFADLDLRFQHAIAFGKEVGYIKAGDPIVLVSGYGKATSFTNFLRIVYATTERSVYFDHPKEFYDNIFLQKPCPNPEYTKNTKASTNTSKI